MGVISRLRSIPSNESVIFFANCLCIRDANLKHIHLVNPAGFGMNGSSRPLPLPVYGFLIRAGVRRRRRRPGQRGDDGVERRGRDLGLDLPAPRYRPSFAGAQEGEESGGPLAVAHRSAVARADKSEICFCLV